MRWSVFKNKALRFNLHQEAQAPNKITKQKEKEAIAKQDKNPSEIRMKTRYYIWLLIALPMLGMHCTPSTLEAGIKNLFYNLTFRVSRGHIILSYESFRDNSYKVPV